jgi:primary-amine oxidase
VNLISQKIESWRDIKDIWPILTLEDLDVIERIARVHPQVIEACKGLGITDMSKVFFDGWAIGVDERWGSERRLQQALAYYRTSPSDNQYAHPLDFTVIADTEWEQVLSVDIRTVNGERTPIPMEEHNYLPELVGKSQYQFNRLKPIHITQPEGVSFTMHGREIQQLSGGSCVV